MRRVQEPITPKFRPGKHIPRWFEWRSTRYEVVRLIETWVKQSEWWRHTGPDRREFYRVEVKGRHPEMVWSRFSCVLMHRTYGNVNAWMVAQVDD